ncbi:unnamed protein product [Dovyalis caffra]|uniref:Uncharacterized protein n=1 Tax=Dovyalis caffra TaxID=77055 RepID=A0AAV1QSW5_9ROSI|nr:unnamed protein product [Dovyalis caffra]
MARTGQLSSPNYFVQRNLTFLLGLDLSREVEYALLKVETDTQVVGFDKKRESPAIFYACWPDTIIDSIRE